MRGLYIVGLAVIAVAAAAAVMLPGLFAPTELEPPPPRTLPGFANMFHTPPPKLVPPRLAVGTRALDFGTVETVGETGQLHGFIVLRNAGGGEAAAREVKLHGEGFILDRSCVGKPIPADGSCGIRVLWRPKRDGAFSGAVTISDAAGAMEQVEITAFLEGPPPPPPPQGPSALELAAAAAAAARRQGRGLAYVHAEPTPAPPAGPPRDPDYGAPKPAFGLPVDRTRVLTADRYIPAVLETAINSQIGGRATAVVSQHVFGAEGRHVLIPSGTRAVGHYMPVREQGQSRLAIVWTRLLRPDGAHIVLHGLPAADQMGRTGMIGDIDSRIFERYGAPLLLSAINALSAAAAQTATGPLVVVQNDLKDQLGEVTARIVDERLKLEPIITLAAGARLYILPTHDLWLREPTVLAALPTPYGATEEPQKTQAPETPAGDEFLTPEESGLPADLFLDEEDIAGPPPAQVGAAPEITAASPRTPGASVAPVPAPAPVGAADSEGGTAEAAAGAAIPLLDAEDIQ